MFDHSRIVSKGEHIILQAPWNVINVHVRQGAIIPMQQNALTSIAVRKTPFSLVISLPSDASLSTAGGYVFLDNGEEIDMTLRRNHSTLVRFEAVATKKSGVITATVEQGEFALWEGWIVDRVVILGVDSTPTIAHVTQKLSKTSAKLFHSGQKLEVSGLKLLLGEAFQIQWGF